MENKPRDAADQAPRPKPKPDEARDDDKKPDDGTIPIEDLDAANDE